MENSDVPDDYIQIKATGSEMSSRIKALMECKRRQADRRNKLDFFGMNRKDHQCARIDAMVNRRKGATSHLQVRFASNAWGPQTTHAIDVNPVAKESHSVIHSNEKSQFLVISSSSSSAATVEEASSSSQFKSSVKQASHLWKTRSYLEAIGKKRVVSLDDIETEIENLKKKMKS